MKATITDHQYSILSDVMTRVSSSSPNELKIFLEKLDIQIFNQISSPESLSDFQVNWLAFVYIHGLLEIRFNPQKYLRDFEMYLHPTRTRPDADFIKLYQKEIMKLQVLHIIQLASSKKGEFEYLFNLIPVASTLDSNDNLLIRSISNDSLLQMFPREDSSDNLWPSSSPSYSKSSLLHSGNNRRAFISSSPFTIGSPPSEQVEKVTTELGTKQRGISAAYTARKQSTQSRKRKRTSAVVEKPPPALASHAVPVTATQVVAQSAETTLLTELNHYKLAYMELSARHTETEKSLLSTKSTYIDEGTKLKAEVEALKQKSSHDQIMGQLQSQNNLMIMSFENKSLKEELETLQATQLELIEDKVKSSTQISSLILKLKESKKKLKQLQRSIESDATESEIQSIPSTQAINVKELQEQNAKLIEDALSFTVREGALKTSLNELGKEKIAASAAAQASIDNLTSQIKTLESANKELAGLFDTTTQDLKKQLNDGWHYYQRESQLNAQFQTEIANQSQIINKTAAALSLSQREIGALTASLAAEKSHHSVSPKLASDESELVNIKNAILALQDAYENALKENKILNDKLKIATQQSTVEEEKPSETSNQLIANLTAENIRLKEELDQAENMEMQINNLLTFNSAITAELSKMQGRLARYETPLTHDEKSAIVRPRAAAGFSLFAPSSIAVDSNATKETQLSNAARPS